ncbi:PRC-barrel domain-containing protein [Maribacter sp. 2307ULW6-5]|uniref:PRC-barrel domain-containing protein n=1 Tax=Maribacter sp. 2307ULW6-5 TaxID=3386275 RepID=UPI0039BCF0F2
MSKTNNNDRNLYYLNEVSDYEVSDSDKDVRGWPLKDKDGVYIGTVANLLVSKQDQRVVYLDVEVDESILRTNHKTYQSPANEGAHGFLNKEGENHLIVPVGMVSLNLEEEIVNTPMLDHHIFSGTKRVAPGSMIDRHYETQVLESYHKDSQLRFSDEEREANNSALYKRKDYTKMYAGAY